MVKAHELNIKTTGDCQVVNITDQVAAAVTQSDMSAGTVTVFNVGSTAGITTTEYEPAADDRDTQRRPKQRGPNVRMAVIVVPGFFMLVPGVLRR